MDSLINLLVAAVLAGTPLLFGTLGEILTEKSGNLNLGVEGIMFMGGVAGLAGAYYYDRAVQSPSGVLALIIAPVCAVFVRRIWLTHLQSADCHAARQSECHRSGAYHLWHWLCQLFRRGDGKPVRVGLCRCG